jgi:hypothetical protein
VAKFAERLMTSGGDVVEDYWHDCAATRRASRGQTSQTPHRHASAQ